MKIKNNRTLSLILVIGWFFISLILYWLFRSNLLIIPILLGSLILTKIVSRLNSSQILNEKRIRKLVDEAKHMLQSSAINYVKITKKSAAHLSLNASKFGGYPFILTQEDYPKDSNGNCLHLLAQFNLTDLPENDFLPKRGLLQFFVADDESFGDYTDTFKVQYIEENLLKKEPINDFSFLPAKKYFPFTGEYSLSFENAKELITLGDHDLEKYLPAELLAEVDNRAYKLEEFGLKFNSAFGHKIGGYGTFPQGDMRPEGSIILLQIDTDGDISWGDSGTAHFFIHPDDLKKLNFEKVVYRWECY